MSGLFGRQVNTAQTEVYAGIQVSTSEYGQVIPFVAGRQRITSNLAWYGNFSAVQGSSPGKGGGSGNGSYTYSAAWLATLCLGGPNGIGGVTRVWHDKAIVDLAFENLSLSLGGDAPPIWPFLSSNFPAQAIPYDRIAYVATPGYNFGSSPSMPNLSYETDGYPQGRSISQNMFDADPSDVISTYLQDPVIGAGFPGTIATLTGATNSYQAYCNSLGLLTSPYENTQRAATDFIAELMQCTNSDVVLTGGLLKVIPYADQAVSGTTPDGTHWSYTPNLTPVFSFTDADYCPAKNQPPVQLTRKPLVETHNIVNVEFVDRANYYNTATAGASDLYDIAMHGPRVMDTVSLHQITSAQVAKTVAQLIMQADLYERNTVTFKVRGNYCILDPMDYIAVSDANLGLLNQVYRVLEVTIAADYTVTIKAMEVPGVVRSTPQYNWDSAAGYFQNYAVSPGSVLPPAIFQMPAIPAATNAGVMLGIAVAGSAANAFWGGCSVYCSIDGGSTYFYVGAVGAQGPSRYGTITTNLAANPDPDLSSTLGIALSNSNLQLQPVTDTDADQMQTLAMIDTGTNVEIISYGSVTLTGPGDYNLSYLRRGQYGTAPPASHSSGARFVRLDGSIFQIGLDPGMAGETVFFKFTSFNIFGQGEEDISTVATYSYQIPTGPVSGEDHLIARGSAALTGTTAYKSSQGAHAWDSDFVTADPIAGGVQVYAKLGVGFDLGVGLVASTASILNPQANMDFCWYLHESVWEIWELGSQRGSFGAKGQADVVQVVYDGFRVTYQLNGVQVRSVQTPAASFYVGAAMFDPGDVLAPLTYTTLAGTVPIGNFLSTAAWRIGQVGSQGHYAQINSNPGGSNAIVLGGDPSNGAPLGPIGQPEALWRATGGTGGTGNVGFSNTLDLAGIDPTKTYRFCCWVQYLGSSGGGLCQINFGCDTNGATTDLGGSVVDTNPYFCFGDLSALTIGQWYLMVGIMHGSSYTGGQTAISGIYDPTIADLVTPGFEGGNSGIGSFISNGSDFKFTAGVVSQTLRILVSDCASSATQVYFARPRVDEMNGHEPGLRDLLFPGAVDPTVTPAQIPQHAPRYGILPRGNVMPIVQNGAFTYTSTTSTLDWSWTAYGVIRPDGSSFNMIAGSQNITGLSASTTYVSYAYSQENAPSGMGFATSSAAVGSPQMAFPPSATYAQLATALAGVSTLNKIFQGKLTGATTASGSGGGGGGGGGFGCPHPDQLVLTSAGPIRASHLEVGDELLTPDGWSPIVKLQRITHHNWYFVEFDNRERLNVTGDHRFVAPDLEQVMACELRIGEILKGRGTQLRRVIAIRWREMEADCVSIELGDPHLYFLTAEGPLSHNLKP